MPTPSSPNTLRSGVLQWSVLTPLMMQLLAGLTASAQTVASIRIPLTAASAFFPGACKAESKKFQTVTDASPADTLKITLVNDRGEGAPAPHALRVITAELDAVLEKDSTQLVASGWSKGGIAGQTLTVVRKADNIAVCVLTVPADPSTLATDVAAENAIRVGVGATFNFLTGVSATNVYADVTAFLPHIWTPQSRRFGMDAGLYNARTVRADTAIESRTNWRVPNEDTTLVRVVSQRRQRALRRQIDRLGFYLAPTLRLTNSLYLFAQAEFAENVVSGSVVSSVSGSPDTLLISRTDTARLRSFNPRNAPRGIAPTIDTTNLQKATVLEPFYTIGALVSVMKSGVEFRVKPQFGYGQPFGQAGAYYAVQFRLTDFTHGFKLGGEVRGLANQTQTTVLVYLAKDFGLKRLAGFVVGGEAEK